MERSRIKEYKEQADSMDLKVSVVIPFYPGRSRKNLNRLLNAIDRQTVQPDEIIVNEKPQSSYANRNEGWRKAKGDIIWFCDADMIPDEDALEKALEVFKNENPCGVEGHIYGAIERIYNMGYMTGHIFYTKEVLEMVSGFDESFSPFWRGDTDLAWTILEIGGDIIYCPESRSAHPEHSVTEVRMENERKLKDKHPELYAKAKKTNGIYCLI